MKKIFSYLLMICLVIPCLFIFTACDETDTDKQLNNDNNTLAEIAGNYTNSIYDTDSYDNEAYKLTMTMTINNNGTYLLTQETISGIEIETNTMSGTLQVNDKKEITNITIDNVADLLDSKQTILGNILPQTSDLDVDLSDLIDFEKYINVLFSNMLIIQDGYLTIASTDDAIILYKANVEKVKNGTVIRTWTDKQFQAIESAFMGLTLPKYDTDYYFVKDVEADFSNSEYKSSFLESFEVAGMIVNDDIVKMSPLTLTDVTNLDLTKTGTGTAQLTYKNAGVDSVLNITYTVVETEEDLPENSVIKVKLDTPEILYIEEGTEFYDLGLELMYATPFSQMSSNPKIQVNSENCTGDNATISLSGYDKTKTGFQIVTIGYRGVTTKQAVYVYDETNNPVINVSVVSGSTVKIIKTTTGETTTYSIDYSEAKIVEEKADGSNSEEITLTANDALNLKALEEYVSGEKVIFKHDVVQLGATYTFYIYLEINIVNA